jgi:enoyl-CoA hydratase
MGRLVLSEDEGAVRTLTLDRPEKLNALSTAMVDRLSQLLGEAAADPGVRVVVIAGAGRSFCSGYDLSEEPGEGDPPSLHPLLDRLLEVFDMPQPVIAQVHGHCLAGGCDLMMMCDLAVASDDAVFGQPEIRFGSAIVAHVMPWLIGARKAKELVLTGFDRLDATTAAELGLVNRVVPPHRLRDATMELAAVLATADPEVMRLTKRALNGPWEAAGFRAALRAGADLGDEIEASRAPERLEFERIAREEGLAEAIRWRDGRFSG